METFGAINCITVDLKHKYFFTHVMAKVKVILPAMGEGVIEATITQWLKKVGDKVEIDDPIVEIATDKVDSEIPAPVAGILNRQMFVENDVPKVGDLIAVIEAENVEDVDPALILHDDKTTTSQKNQPFDSISGSVSTPNEQKVSHKPESVNTHQELFLSPLVKSMVTKENISLNVLQSIQGTGLDGRITKDDILAYLKHNVTEKAEQVDNPKMPSEGKLSIDTSNAKLLMLPSDEIIEMGRMRKLIAEHMVVSKRVSPHVTSFIEVDVTAMVSWRNRNKELFLAKHAEKLTFTPLFIEAVVRAIADFPMINVSVSGDKIILHKQINIGMATALPNGNLIVPVIKLADEKNLVGVAQSVNDLAHRARKSKLKPDEIKGSTFTITNVGTFNNITGTPVINQPEVAIIAFGAIKKKPAVIETPTGDTIGIRHIMVVSMSYDHRVVDGSLGGMFIDRVGRYLEDFDVNRNI